MELNNHLFGRIYVANKKENVKLNVLNKNKRIQKSNKTYFMWFICKFDGRIWNLNQKWNNIKCRCVCVCVCVGGCGWVCVCV